MGFFKKLFGWEKETPTVRSVNQSNDSENNVMNYFVFMDNEVFGPFTLQELKSDYPILEDTLITVDALNGEWFEAKCFECFDEIFNPQLDFRINEFGEIMRS